jgi:hypothetical protein
MTELRNNTTIIEGPGGNIYDSSKRLEVNEKFCHNCASFNAIK